MLNIEVATSVSRELGSPGSQYLKAETIVPILAVTILVFSCSFSMSAQAASSSQFASTNAAIASAFAATSNAKQSGGNVTGLVANLNLALNLTQEALSVNSTNPAESTILLQNATRLANQVSSQAASVQSSGASARQFLTEESVGGAIATIVVAALIYIYGGRIYRMIWFFIYRNHVVRRIPAAGKANG
jgi:hypothetical protein